MLLCQLANKLWPGSVPAINPVGVRQLSVRAAAGRALCAGRYTWGGGQMSSTSVWAETALCCLS